MGSVIAGVKEHMASGDPRLGVADSWRRSDLPTKSKEDDTKPTLYHTDTSYYSQVVRLVLEEECIDYVSRHLDIHGSMEQLEPWYLRIQPRWSRSYSCLSWK